jgi:hypothetical protein
VAVFCLKVLFSAKNMSEGCSTNEVRNLKTSLRCHLCIWREYLCFEQFFVEVD